MATKATPLIAFQATTVAPLSPTAIAMDHSLLELDMELDALLDQIQDEIEEVGEASAEAMERLQLFCKAMDVKIDRIGRFLRIMETRAEYCKKESARYAARARRAQGKIERAESMVLYYLASHDLKKIESHEFTLKRNKNSQDSVEITHASNLASHRIAPSSNILPPVAWSKESRSNADTICGSNSRRSITDSPTEDGLTLSSQQAR